MHQVTRTNVLGVGVSAINMDQCLDVIDGWIRHREPHYVCITGVHGVMESQDDETLKRIHNAAGLVTPDGMPLVWISRLAGHQHVQRVYGPDLMLASCERSLTQGYRHFLYGGAPGVADELADRLQERFPGLRITGTFSPPFRALTEDEERDVRERIAASEADIVWVGLGTPKQERWMASHVGRVGAPVLIGVGAAFDFHTGRKAQAPAWMQRMGLEWAFRMATEPRRLAARYLRNNPRFLWAFLGQWLGWRRYALPEPDEESRD